MKMFSRVLLLTISCLSVQFAHAQGIGADSVRLGSSSGGSIWLSMPSGSASNYRLILPSSSGLLPNQLMYLNGTTGQVNLLSPGNNGELLRLNGGSLTWIHQDTLLALTGWSLTGNSGTNPASNFLGTNDGQPLRLVTNGSERLRILSGGNIGIGTSTPTQLLHMVGGHLLIDTVTSGTAGQIRLNNPSGTFYTSLKAGAQAANISYTLPTTAPSNGQFLTTDGSANLSWVSLASLGTGTTNNSTLRYNSATSQWVENTNVLATTSGAVTLGGNSSAGSLAINDGQVASKTATIVAANQAANRTYTIPDAGAAANFVMTESAQTVNGVKTFGSAPVISPFTSAGLVKNNASGVLSSGQASLSTDVSGVLPIANGGTNSSTALNNNRIMVSSGGSIVESGALTNGQVLIGSTGSAPTVATLTAGSGISITNGAGSITIANTSASVGAGSTNNSTLRYNSATSQWVENTNVLATTGGAVSLGGNSSAGSLAINDGQVASKTATIVAANQAANRTYTIPDAGAAANFVMTESAQTVNGVKTFGSAPVISPFTSAGLVKNNASGVLSSGQASLTTDVSGILPVANGGTGVATMTGFPSGNGTAAMTARTMTGTSNQITVTNGDGVSGNPTFSISNDAIFPGSGANTIPSGATGSRPGVPTNGMMRYNSTTNLFEFYQNGSWTNFMSTGASIPLSSLTAAASTNSINNADYAQTWQWNSLSSNSALSLTSSSTAAASNTQTLLNLALSGANATTTQTTYGMQVANTHTGTSSTNIGGYFSASGGTNNYGLLVANGNTGLGTTTPGATLDVKGTLRLSGSTSGYVGFAPAAAAGSTTYTLPSADGSSGQVLSTNGSGTLSWSSSSINTPISGLTAATATNSINNAAYQQTWQWNTLAGTSGLSLTSSSTAAASNAQTLFNIALSGANATTTQTTYGMQVANTHTGTSSTNVGGYFSASGGTNNYGLLVASGNTGLGTTTPGSTLDVKGTLRLSGSTSGYVGFAPAAAAGSTTYTLPSADGSNGQALLTNGSGTLSWGAPSGTTPISSLTAAGATNSINNADYAQTWQWNTLSSNSALSLTSSSTAASSNTQTLLNLALSGANATTTQTTYGMQVANTHTGTSSTNIGGYFSASGGTNNYGLLVANGNTGLGTTTPGSTLDVKGTIRLSGSTSGYVGFAPAATAGSTTYTLPSADGSNGQLLATDGSGNLSWSSSSPLTPLSGLTAATATNSINNAGYAQTWQWNSLAGASALSLTSTSTSAASSAQTLLNIALSGANSSSSQTTYGMKAANTHTGTSSTNVGGYFSASGGSNNYGLIVANGRVGIGTTSPSQLVETMNGNINIGNNNNTAGELRLTEPSSSGSNYTAFKAGAQSSNITYTLPTSDGASNASLTTDGSGTLSWSTFGRTQYVRKTSDQQVTNSTTLVDDNDFSFSIGANEVWEVNIMLRVTGSSGDFKFTVTTPTGATQWISVRGDADDSYDDYGQITTSGSTLTLNNQFGISDTGTLIELKGLVANSSTSGTFKFRWAQNVSSGTATTVKSLSYMKYTRVE